MAPPTLALALGQRSASRASGGHPQGEIHLLPLFGLLPRRLSPRGSTGSRWRAAWTTRARTRLARMTVDGRPPPRSLERRDSNPTHGGRSAPRSLAQLCECRSDRLHGVDVAL